MDLERLLAGLTSQAGSAAGGAAASDGLMSCRAGTLSQSGTAVTADARKGKLVFLERDGLLHVQWQLRPSGEVQEDYIVLPNEATVELIPECTDGRVLMVEFAGDRSRRRLYWLQEPKADHDASLIEQMNGYLSGRTPLTGGARPAPGTLDQNQLLAMLTGQSLGAVLNPDHVIPLLQRHPDLVAAVLPDLPEGQRSREALEQQLRSPQLQQTLNRLTAAINSGQGQALLQQLGLPADQDVGVDALLSALQRQSDQNRQR
ncbi:hypothetical protein PBRA_008981 [Plasmodiophora brassicae]|uniref:Uncharacterized protein n=1 Tax=Plasmodiophora brassicae TaxID=37360 RepID=A0A0G4J4F8_PLABS|nr:hypothetical protein PBRA_008981 [Plasmodiophora brassicae]